MGEVHAGVPEGTRIARPLPLTRAICAASAHGARAELLVISRSGMSSRAHRFILPARPLLKPSKITVEGACDRWTTGHRQHHQAHVYAKTTLPRFDPAPVGRMASSGQTPPVWKEDAANSQLQCSAESIARLDLLRSVLTSSSTGQDHAVCLGSVHGTTSRRGHTDVQACGKLAASPPPRTCRLSLRPVSEVQDGQLGGDQRRQLGADGLRTLLRLFGPRAAGKGEEGCEGKRTPSEDYLKVLSLLAVPA